MDLTKWMSCTLIWCYEYYHMNMNISSSFNYYILRLQLFDQNGQQRSLWAMDTSSLYCRTIFLYLCKSISLKTFITFTFQTLLDTFRHNSWSKVISSTMMHFNSTTISSGEDRSPSRFASLPAGLSNLLLLSFFLGGRRGIGTMGVKICHFSKSKPKIFPRHLIYIHWGEKYENICWHFWDWLIVALSGLRGKRPMRRSGKKLPTFCVFCKVWILILNISSNKTNSKGRNCTFFFKVRAIPFHHFPTHNKLINSNSSFISVAACHSPHAFVKNKKSCISISMSCALLSCAFWDSYSST